MYTNADSLLNKKKELENIVNSKNGRPDIIAVTEVKSKRFLQTHLPEFSIARYNMISNDLDNSDNRGIVIYIHEQYDSALVDVNSNFSESLIVNIKKFNKLGENLLVACIYRSPNSPEKNNQDLLELITNIAEIKSKKCIILGDFNFPGIEWEY